MANWFKNLFLNEETKAFQNKGDHRVSDKKLEKQQGEGYETLGIDVGSSGLASFNTFYNNYLNKQLNSNNDRTTKYRSMATMPEISDVVEDAVNESTQENDAGDVLELQITNEKLSNNENITDVLNKEFNDLFFDSLNINKTLWDLYYSYMVDGRLYFERIINISRHKEGIKSIKRLPTSSMDYFYNYKTGRIDAFIQYKKPNAKKPVSVDEAKKDANVVVFIPEQIGFIPYRYGNNKNDIFGYLENCKIAYNQLKLLEASVIIYRLVRAPERFVFKIDVGAMPKDKALAYVNKIKRQMNRKQTYNPDTGVLEGTNNVNSILDNIWIPQSDNRGSDVETIGGNSQGFTELGDIEYFAKKLYRSLKYPMSRIENSLEGRTGDNLFRSGSITEITRDEIKWSRFLERQQDKFCDSFKELFLLHLEFKGLKQQYSLTIDDLNLIMTPPSDYKAQMEQQLLEIRFNNYTTLSNEEEFSKTYLQKKYLGWSDEEVQDNLDKKMEDIKNAPEEDDGY